jgi:hypothetical protein
MYSKRFLIMVTCGIIALGAAVMNTLSAGGTCGSTSCQQPGFPPYLLYGTALLLFAAASAIYYSDRKTADTRK